MNAFLKDDDVRRLEERALNASGAFQSLVYDGWLLGYRRGPTKRLRCVNPFYPSALPLAEKLAYCIAFYEGAGLPAVFRLLPFSQPPELDSYLGAMGWASFERTLVLHAAVNETAQALSAADGVDIVSAVELAHATVDLLKIESDAVAQIVQRAKTYPLPHAGAIIRRDDEVVACGLLKLEGDHAGLFAVNTASALRGQGLGRAIVSALLNEASRRGARTAYLQVTADNVAALALYRHFGFSTAYDYWYRARDGERR